MKKLYEVYQGMDGCSLTLGTPETFQQLRSNGLLENDAKLLFWIIADTLEEAMAVRNIKMGWAPYVPEGEPKECPRGCGAMFYPEGSGECPNCGRIC
jgi:hypothetical protein